VVSNSGWRPDPSGRHQERYFNAEGVPTRLVRNDGFESTDEQGNGPCGPPPSATTPEPARRGTVAQASPVRALGEPTSRAPLSAVGSETSPTPDVGPPTEEVAVVAPVPSPVPAPLAPTIIRRHRSPWLIAAMCAMAVLLGAAIATGVQQHSEADRWMHDDLAAMHKNAGLTASLRSSEGRVSSLGQKLSSTRSQLSAAAAQNQKAFDQQALLATSLSDGNVVASDIDACVTDMQTVLSDIAQLPQTGAVPASTYSDVTTTADACEGAQAEDAALQRALSHG